MICNQLKSCYENKKKDCLEKSICIKQSDSRKNVTCEENRKRYNLINKHLYEIIVYHMDGGIIRNEPNVVKCDYLYVVKDEGNPTAIFIELKGKDVLHALEQLKETIARFSPSFPKYRILARMVCKSVPRLYNDPSIQNYKKLLKKQYNGNLIIKESNYEEEYT